MYQTLILYGMRIDAKQRDENKVLPLTRLLADTKWIMWTMLLATLGVGVIL